MPPQNLDDMCDLLVDFSIEHMLSKTQRTATMLYHYARQAYELGNHPIAALLQRSAASEHALSRAAHRTYVDAMAGTSILERVHLTATPAGLLIERREDH